MTIYIAGAGMAGLLAANMLARHKPVVLERQSSLPNNHSAVLRFRSEKVSEVLGIPFKSVTMMKGTIPGLNPVADALAYSMKCSGIFRSDRSIPVGVETGQRWIAPPDLIERMARDVNIMFNAELAINDNKDLQYVSHSRKFFDYIVQPIISTMPMPALMDLLEYPDKPEFSFVEGANIRAKVYNCDAYVSLYAPQPDLSFNRVSITGDELIVEYAFPNSTLKDAFYSDISDKPKRVQLYADSAAVNLGVHAWDATAHPQRYAKIQPIDNDTRKKFLAWATDNHNIFSLGRFATWRPGLLLDDLVHDVRLIEKWINNRYDMKATHR